MTSYPTFKDDGHRARAVLEAIRMGRLKGRAAKENLDAARFQDAKDAADKINLNDKLDDL